AADDDELGRLRMFDQPTSRVIEHNITATATSGYCWHHPASCSARILSSTDFNAGQSTSGIASALTSVHARRTTSSTPRCEASSKAIAVADSDGGEPSVPTSTGARPARGRRRIFVMDDRDRALR